MRICTFNVNSVKARLDLVLNWLEQRKNDIDILCLQELKTVEAEFPFEEFEKRGFTSEVFGEKAYNGVAICSKLPLSQVRKGFSDGEWDRQKRLISASVGGLNLVNVYAPHGGLRGSEKFRFKREWFDKLTGTLASFYTPRDRLVLVGDFNVANEDLDVYSPQDLADAIGTMPEEREAFRKLLSWGLVDAFRHNHPQARLFTWWDYRTAGIWRDEGMRIDYILCTRAVLPSIGDIGTDLWPRRRRTPIPSDHAPLIATLAA